MFLGKGKLGGWKKTRFTWKMDEMGKEAVVEVEFFQHLIQIKIFTYIPWLGSFDLSAWKFIIGWWYSPDSLCLSILRFFTSQLLAELKNTNMILKQLQKNNGSKGQKRWSTNWPCWLVLITKRSLQHTFSCYISSGGGSFIS